MPGETIRIEDTSVYINELKIDERETYCYEYIDTPNRGVTLTKTYSNREYSQISDDRRKQLLKISSTKPSPFFPLFPVSKHNRWTRDNYGSLIIPKKGMTIVLDKDNIDTYKEIISNYEMEAKFVLNGKTKKYTFKNNYYFMLGDNRHNSVDSRSYGFVPESYIQGKMISIL